MEYKNFKSKIDSLVKAEGPCLSMIIPTHRVFTSDSIYTDRMRFGHAITEATDLIAQKGEAYSFLIERLDTLLKKYGPDEKFWQYQSDSLVIYQNEEINLVWTLPIQHEGIVVADNHFFIQPLVPFIDREGYTYILLLSRGAVRLLEANPFNLYEIKLSDEVPQGEVEAIKMIQGGDYDPQVELQFHSSGNKGAPVYHGHGGADKGQELDEEKYLRTLDRKLMDEICDPAMPMVLAGVESVVRNYQQISSYPNIMEEIIPGNQENEDLMWIYESAMDILKQSDHQNVQDKIDDMEQIHPDGKIYDDLERSIPLAFQGRADKLLFRKNSLTWGEVDAKGQVSLNQERMNDSIVVENNMILNTLKYGGEVYAVEQAHMPGSIRNFGLTIRN
ncbi:MAG: hypothetical protein AAGI38_21235 [Bacteroidota bacterium]